jgi:hypothetical protein
VRGELPLGRWLSIGFADVLGAEYWRVTDEVSRAALARGHHVFRPVRQDVVLRLPGDWLLTNGAALLLGVRAHRNIGVQIGITDELILVPSLHYIGNIAGGIVTLLVRRLGDVAQGLYLSLRVGSYTRHAFREGEVAVGINLGVTYELWRARHGGRP